MTLLRLKEDSSSPANTESNPTLKGHKLLLLSPWPTPQPALASLHAKFPDLEVVVHQHPFENRDPFARQPREGWKDVTVLLTGAALPDDVRDVPVLQYVQLVSAGANHIVQKPVFKDTEIPFCTANGVHGCVSSSSSSSH
jgi:hypothetical protein